MEGHDARVVGPPFLMAFHFYRSWISVSCYPAATSFAQCVKPAVVMTCVGSYSLRVRIAGASPAVHVRSQPFPIVDTCSVPANTRLSAS
jgi:hypothetical protein